MKSESLISGSQQETEALGRKLGTKLKPPQTLLLYGALGAGKTALTRGIVEGLGVVDPSIVHSPTFSLVNEYSCTLAKVYHVDLYRLDSRQDFYSIGLDEILASEAVIIIEWAEKLLLPVYEPLHICIDIEDDERRLVTISKAKPSLYH